MKSVTSSQQIQQMKKMNTLLLLLQQLKNDVIFASKLEDQVKACKLINNDVKECQTIPQKKRIAKNSDIIAKTRIIGTKKNITKKRHPQLLRKKSKSKKVQ